MNYRVQLAAKAEKSFLQLRGKDRDLVTTALDDLEVDPTVRNPNITALQGQLKGLLRYRKGSFRVVFKADHEARIVTVAHIANRRDAYRK